MQERSSSAYALIQYLKSELDQEREQGVDDMMTDDDTAPIEKNSLIDTIIDEMTLLFTGDLNPVAPKAQKKVMLPEGLDIDEWINSPLSDNVSSSEDEKGDFLFVANQSYDGVAGQDSRKSSPEITKEDVERARRSRELQQSHNPNYLKSSNKKSKKQAPVEDDIDDIPIAEIALDVPLKIHSTKRSDKYLQQDRKASTKTKRTSKKTSKKHKNKLSYSSSESEYDEILPVQVSTVVEIPEGATLSDSDNDQKDENDPHTSLNIDLDIPVQATKTGETKAKSDKKKSHVSKGSGEAEKEIKERKKKHKKERDHTKISKKKDKQPQDVNLFEVEAGDTKEETNQETDDKPFKTKSASNKKKHSHDKQKKQSKVKKSSSKTGYEEFSTPTK